MLHWGGNNRGGTFRGEFSGGEFAGHRFLEGKRTKCWLFSRIIKTYIICYADDIAILARSTIDLQKMLDKLYLGLDHLGLTVNVSKCAHLVFKMPKKTHLTIRDAQTRYEIYAHLYF